MSTYIMDTAEVLFTRKSDGHTVFTAEAQLAGITQSVSEEIVRGGIGNRSLFSTRHSKEIGLNVRNALFNLEWLRMTQGTEIVNGTVQIKEVEKALKVVDNAGTLEVTVVGTPVGTTVRVINKDGESEDAVVAGKKVTIPVGHAAEDETVNVVYTKEVTGNSLAIDADTFSEAYEVQYRTIEYDAKTNKVVKDIYFKFGNVLPSGSIDMNLENGTALTPELSFSVYADDNGLMGEVIEVDRA